MKQKVFYWIIGVVCCWTSSLQAQWTEKDSVWLQQFLSGEAEIRLNPEIEEVIRSGNFLNIDPEAPSMLLSPLMLEVIKDIPEAALRDPLYRELLITSLPPAVFKKYTFSPDSGMVIHKQALAPPKSILVKDRFQLGKGFYMRGSAENLFLPHVRDGQRRGSIGGAAGVGFSMEDILCALFSPTERNKKRNRKYARAWKDYNMDTLY